MRAALRANPHVPGYLLQEKPMPDRMPDYVGFGDESEAIAYGAENGILWFRTLGALAWMQSVRRSRALTRETTRVTQAVTPPYLSSMEINGVTSLDPDLH